MKGSKYDDSILAPGGFQGSGTGARDAVLGDHRGSHLFSHYFGERRSAAAAGAVD
jgi:hypothetical protein